MLRSADLTADPVGCHQEISTLKWWFMMNVEMLLLRSVWFQQGYARRTLHMEVAIALFSMGRCSGYFDVYNLEKPSPMLRDR